MGNLMHQCTREKLGNKFFKVRKKFHIATNLIIKFFADSRKDFELQLNNVEIIVGNNKSASCF